MQKHSYGLSGATPQVLAEQARRVGITIEAENALEQSAARAAVSKKKKDPGYSLEISSIHRRVKEMMRSRGSTPEAEAVASKGPVYQPLQDAESDLPPGWEARLDESSGGAHFCLCSCHWPGCRWYVFCIGGSQSVLADGCAVSCKGRGLPAWCNACYCMLQHSARHP